MWMTLGAAIALWGACAGACCGIVLGRRAARYDSIWSICWYDIDDCFKQELGERTRKLLSAKRPRNIIPAKDLLPQNILTQTTDYLNDIDVYLDTIYFGTEP